MTALLRFLFPCRSAESYYARHSSLPSLREMCIGGAMVAAALGITLLLAIAFDIRFPT